MERHEHASHDEAPSIGRRRFVRWLGLGGLFAGFAGALSGLAAGDARGQAVTPPAATPPATPATPATPPPPSDEARALHAALVARYGTHLDDAQKEALLPAMEGTVQSANALRARKLANSVEPDTIFRAVEPRRRDAVEGGR